MDAAGYGCAAVNVEVSALAVGIREPYRLPGSGGVGIVTIAEDGGGSGPRTGIIPRMSYVDRRSVAIRIG